MSVEALAALVEQVLASLPRSRVQAAVTGIEEARAILIEAAQGSDAPELLAAIQGLGHAVEEGTSTLQSCEHLHEALQAYLASLGVAAPSRAAPPTRPKTPEKPRQTVSSSAPDHALIVEVQQRGYKISSDRVVRIARDRDQRVVWLEEGDERSGLRHIMQPKKISNFQRAGIPEDRIVDVVFDALVNGKFVGFMGVDRPVYEVELDGKVSRIAITTGENGYVVGANPVSMRSKLKGLP